MDTPGIEECLDAKLAELSGYTESYRASDDNNNDNIDSTKFTTQITQKCLTISMCLL